MKNLFEKIFKIRFSNLYLVNNFFTSGPDYTFMHDVPVPSDLNQSFYNLDLS